ncbi:MAG: hypothetical protein Edafosvirus58_1, partial [Edafosvirus sp.]
FLMNMYFAFCSHLIEMRNYYLEKNKKTIFDNTLFQEFVIDCIGKTMMPAHERQLLIEERKKKNKPYTFRYEPSDKNKDISASNYVFANSSGNAINNPKNLKLSADKKDTIGTLESYDDDNEEIK